MKTISSYHHGLVITKGSTLTVDNVKIDCHVYLEPDAVLDAPISSLGKITIHGKSYNGDTQFHLIDKNTPDIIYDPVGAWTVTATATITNTQLALIQTTTAAVNRCTVTLDTVTSGYATNTLGYKPATGTHDIMAGDLTCTVYNSSFKTRIAIIDLLTSSVTYNNVTLVVEDVVDATYDIRALLLSANSSLTVSDTLTIDIKNFTQASGSWEMICGSCTQSSLTINNINISMVDVSIPTATSTMGLFMLYNYTTSTIDITGDINIELTRCNISSSKWYLGPNIQTISGSNTSGYYTHTGNLTLTITGGVYNEIHTCGYNTYGAHRLKITGDIYITLDTSTPITINKLLLSGRLVTHQGDAILHIKGSDLTCDGATSQLLGCGSHSSNIRTGSSTIKFDNYIGDLDVTEIYGFAGLELLNGSQVNITEPVNWAQDGSYIRELRFDYGSCWKQTSGSLGLSTEPGATPVIFFGLEDAMLIGLTESVTWMFIDSTESILNDISNDGLGSVLCRFSIDGNLIYEYTTLDGVVTLQDYGIIVHVYQDIPEGKIYMELSVVEDPISEDWIGDLNIMDIPTMGDDISTVLAITDPAVTGIARSWTGGYSGIVFNLYYDTDLSQWVLEDIAEGSTTRHINITALHLGGTYVSEYGDTTFGISISI